MSVIKVSNEYSKFKNACIAQTASKPALMQRVKVTILAAKAEAEAQKLGGELLAEYFSRALSNRIARADAAVQEWFIAQVLA